MVRDWCMRTPPDNKRSGCIRYRFREAENLMLCLATVDGGNLNADSKIHYRIVYRNERQVSLEGKRF